MSRKDTIYDALMEIGLPLSYADSDANELPRINFWQVWHGSVRLSNKRANQRFVHQVDFFSGRPLNPEDDEVLWKIIENLEAEGLVTTDWQEVHSYDEDIDRSVFHYYIEVR